MPRFAIHLLALVTFMACAQRSASAAEHVRFESARYQLGPLQRRLALERREPILAPAPDTIDGFLTKPDGAGPFPALVHLHGCGGLPSAIKTGAQDHFWAKQLAAWGYVVLVVDSFTARGISNSCSGEAVARVGDAYGAHAYLAGLPFVDPNRIGVIGFSAGGIATLSIAEAREFELFENESERRFSAAVAYYPACGAGDVMRIPTLILIGEQDDWSLASGCRRMAARQRAASPVTLVTYPGAYHSFDVPAAGRRYFGHWLEYNAAAAQQAAAEVRRFLAEQFGR